MTQHISIDHAHQLNDLVKRAISSSILMSHQNIQFEIDQEQVILTGIVNSYYQKQLAQESVIRVQGIRQVHNRLHVASTQQIPDESWTSILVHSKPNRLESLLT